MTKLPDQNNSPGKLGLEFSLSDGGSLHESHQVVSSANATPLSIEEVQSVLDRLPPLQAQHDEIQEFSLPAESRPPPALSEKLEVPFPPTITRETPEQPSPGPLEVVRYAPEGEVPFASLRGKGYEA